MSTVSGLRFQDRAIYLAVESWFIIFKGWVSAKGRAGRLRST